MYFISTNETQYTRHHQQTYTTSVQQTEAIYGMWPCISHKLNKEQTQTNLDILGVLTPRTAHSISASLSTAQQWLATKYTSGCSKHDVRNHTSALTNPQRKTKLTDHPKSHPCTYLALFSSSSAPKPSLHIPSLVLKLLRSKAFPAHT